MTSPGERLADRYRLVEQIAAGGMGSVWRAWDEVLHRQVAVKLLHPQRGLNDEDAAMTRNRVIREARITARLHHPHAVTLYDVIEYHGQPCLILQYVPSRSLSSLMAEQGSLPVPFVARIGADVASALDAAHQVGIVHRDVKPSNVLITPDGSATVTDFGISHAAGDITLTMTGMVTGTPAFLAPEVARGAPSGYPADVFSLGATLYAAVEGHPPFGTDQNAMALLHKVASGQVIPPQRTGSLTDLLLQMLSATPADRPQMGEISTRLAALADAATFVPVLPAITGAPDESSETEASLVPLGSGPNSGSRQRPAVWALVAVLTLTVIAAVIAAVVLFRPGSNDGNTAVTSAPGTSVASGGPAAAPAVTASSAGAVRQSRTPESTGGAQVPPGGTTAGTAVRTTTAGTTTAPSRSTAPTSTVQSTGTSKSATISQVTSAATPTHDTSTTVTASSTASAPTAHQLSAAVTDYYAMLPGDTNAGWNHLTSDFQQGTARNRAYYQQFWDGVRRVTTSDVHSTGPNSVQATITYNFTDGRTAVEVTDYTLRPEGGILKIEASQVVSSDTQ